MTQSRSGGQSYTGVEQIVTSPAFRWSIKLTGVLIKTADHVLAWRSIEGQLDGRAGTILVPAYDWARSPGGPSRLVPHSDGASFSDQGLFRGASTAITLSADADANDATLSIAWTGPRPEPGQHFSIAGRLYRVIYLDVTAANQGRVSIRPWLRADANAGTRLDFENPVCTCRLATDDAMTLDLELWRRATPTVEFVEAF